MAGNKPPPSSSSSKPPPSITLPPRTSIESLFTGGAGASPGPMSLVSSFFAENDPDNDCRSFSQLLAGAVQSTADEFRFQQNRPAVLAVSHPPGAGTFTVPPGLSPATLLDSPDLFSFVAGSYYNSLSHYLSRIIWSGSTQAQAQMQFQYSSFPSAPASSISHMQPIPSNASFQQHIPPPLPDTKNIKESSDFSQSDQKFQPANFAVDKPTDDGYNWRKYGQKQVKGSEFPRSYYKCTHPSCPVKKKVERSLDGQITEIIYKGQHNHPQPSKRPKDSGGSNGTMNPQRSSEFGGDRLSKPEEGGAKDQGSSQLTPEQVSGSSDSEEVAGGETRVDDGHEDEPESKRRIVEVQNPEQASSSHRTVTEPRIIVQTTSEVDLLDDGYRWRKYGQKVVKGNPYPRSYYKCTTAGCNVRKHVERAASDPKAVITTYEGKHNHDVPAAKNSSHGNANAATQFRPQNPVANRPAASRGIEYGNEQQSVALLRFKEEQIT
uniref:WRKY protein n=1 Tax=Salvia miltiorrhiza TaxID=226208 RepID=A0A0D5YA37_SALMI|nr:WRKY protein [Salvia miltiorrhiza]